VKDYRNYSCDIIINMKWYLGIIAWVADAIKRKAELNEDDSVDDRLERIEQKLDQVKKSGIPVAVFASGLPIYAIGLAGSLKNTIELITFEWNNLLYLVIGMFLVIWAMTRLKVRDSHITITLLLTIVPFIIVTVINIIRFNLFGFFS